MKNFHVRNEFVIGIDINGMLDRELITAVIRDVSHMAIVYKGYNFLLDARKVRLIDDVTAVDAMRFAMEAYCYHSALRGKIATLLPEGHRRKMFTETFQAAMQIKSINYRHFSDEEQALTWLTTRQS